MESVNANIKVKKVNDNIFTAMHMDHETLCSKNVFMQSLLQKPWTHSDQ